MRSSRILVALMAVALGAPAAALAADHAPYDVAAWGGHVYVAEYYAGRVVERDASGNVLGSYGQPGSGPGQLSRPSAVALAPGRLYVADYGNNRIDVFSTQGEFLFSFGHFATTFAPGVLWNPSAIAVGPQRGYVYVSDRHGMIQVFTRDGKFVRWWGHRDQDHRSGAWLHLVDALEIDSKAHVYAADAVDGVVKEFGSGGKLLRTIGPGLGSWTLDRPSGLAIAPDGSLYVSDALGRRADHSSNEKVLHLSADGHLLASWGVACHSCSPGTNTDGPLSFWSPQGLAVADGRLYVADSGNDRVQALGLDGSFLASWPSS